MNSVGFRNAAAVGVALTIFVAFTRGLSVDAVAIISSTDADDIVHSQNQSTDAESRHYIRGERKAALITERLPDMKVCLNSVKVTVLS